MNHSSTILPNAPHAATPHASLSAERLVLNIRDLPSIPGIMVDALHILDNHSSSAEEIGEVVQRDQVLAAKSLRVVNSAAFGFSRPIGTIREAIVMIGVRRIRGMVGAMATSGLFAKGIPGLVDPRFLWAHSLAASMWATEIIDFKKLWSAQSAVIGALLHDLGVVILCQYATDRYRIVLEMARDEQLPLQLVEQREFGTTHASVGAALCAKWKLPPVIYQLVEHHHAGLSTVDKSDEVVVLANHLAYLQGMKPFAWGIEPVLPAGLLESLGMDAESLHRLQEKKAEAVELKTNALLDAAEDNR